MRRRRARKLGLALDAPRPGRSGACLAPLPFLLASAAADPLALARATCQTVGFFLARLLVFRIKEAPRFLAAAGRHAEAVDALRYIASFNGTLTGRVEKEFEAILWNARRVDAVGAPDGYATPSLPRDRLAPPPPLSTSSSSESYAATASSAADGRSTFAFATPTREESQAYLSDLRSSAADAQPSLNLPSNDDPTPSRAAPRRLGSHSPLRAPDQPAASPLSPAHLWQHALESAAEAKDKLLEIFRPEWRRTTVLIWIIWSCLSMAYTSACLRSRDLVPRADGTSALSPCSSVQRLPADDP